jgi:ABC-type sugar transport system ATPase subunit
VLDDRDVARLAPAQREIGYVPQDGVLFPTMRVDRQIGFGMEVRNIDRMQRLARVRELAALLEIENLLHRYPRGLSGGEKQRIVLARALSFRPKLLCLDEPLSALDGSTRTRLAELLKTVHQHEGVTVLHITHSIDEGERLGTEHFHLVDGKIV